jgi:hypothetical protein
MVRDKPEVNRMISQMTALRRPGVPDDIGPMIASLLSDANRWMNPAADRGVRGPGAVVRAMRLQFFG